MLCQELRKNSNQDKNGFCFHGAHNPVWNKKKDFKSINKQNNYRCDTRHEGNKPGNEIESNYIDWLGKFP